MGNSIGKLIYFFFALGTGVIGTTINDNVGWGIINFIFAPVSWVKWMICKDVTMTIIKQSFDWFFI